MSEGHTLTVLGIETSCDETAAALVTRTEEGKGQVLSNIVRTQAEEHASFGGIVPEIAARSHVSFLDGIISDCFKEARLTLSDVSAVAATAGPGLLGGLIVGVVTGKALALAHKKPFLAINHLEAHALTVGLTEGLRPPYLLLLVSGGHTQLLYVKALGIYERLGTTIDDALGEAFDKTAKLLGLPQPGGPFVEKAAQTGNPRRFSFPRPMVGREEAHFSYAGLKTAVRRKAQELSPLSAQDRADLSASFQAAAFETVLDRVQRSMQIVNAQTPAQTPRRLVVSGGVAANRTLRAQLETLTRSTHYELYIPPAALCADNGAMIAWAGAEKLAHGHSDPFDIPARARWPLDLTARKALGAGVKA